MPLYIRTNSDHYPWKYLASLVRNSFKKCYQQQQAYFEAGYVQTNHPGVDHLQLPDTAPFVTLPLALH